MNNAAEKESEEEFEQMAKKVDKGKGKAPEVSRQKKCKISSSLCCEARS
jgi:hypothetical protein